MNRRIEIGTATVEFSDEAPSALSSQTPARDPVVLLHGFTGSKESWRDLREQLRTDRRVISIDLPGHGGTRVGIDVENYSIERAAAMAIRLLTDVLAVPRFSLLGYSMGGRLALFIALNYGAHINRLVLESASPGLADSADRAARRHADAELAAFAESAGIEAFVKRWESIPLFESMARMPAEKIDRLRRERLGCCVEELARSLRGMGTGVQPWLGDELPALRMPILAIAGALDPKFTAIGEQMAALAGDARFEAIDGAGHAPHLERPREFNCIVTDFLNGKRQK
ncbi:MAG: 2-succinyl-6-hydroxy-2,4-cyclohexadiene-1-carboxylate synthase [Candidatus Binatus sp.]|jgi:2-succinyl-6-hydroxy-2,4-cyclohexadiene-1-carboxylate synthase|uniref:2-succinyl-6-hydroxy-2, 4-cyclohexadiene-1-carboxylate synthase n=1 Tax=Candidatus Binatus sp. TaxID=2811406 RepID=UPI003CB22B0A